MTKWNALTCDHCDRHVHLYFVKASAGAYCKRCLLNWNWEEQQYLKDEPPMTTATCDTCPNPQRYALVAWGDGFRCYECAPDKPPAPESPSGFDDVEWWDMSDLEAHVQASMEPKI